MLKLPSCLPGLLEARLPRQGSATHHSIQCSCRGAPLWKGVVVAKRYALPPHRSGTAGEAEVIDLCLSDHQELVEVEVGDEGESSSWIQDELELDIVPLAEGDVTALLEKTQDVLALVFLRSLPHTESRWMVAREDFLAERFSRLQGVRAARCSRAWSAVGSPVAARDWIGYVRYSLGSSSSPVGTDGASSAWHDLLLSSYGDVPIEEEQHLVKDVLAIINYGSGKEVRQPWTDAADRLGLRVVLLVEPNDSWAKMAREQAAVQRTSQGKRREREPAEFPFAVVECDLSLSDSSALVGRLIAAIEGWQVQSGVRVNGLIGPSESYLLAATEVCLQLSLPTYGTVESLRSCADKTLFRSLFPWRGCLPRVLRSAKDAHGLRDWSEWPAILKPITDGGGGAQGVYRVDDFEELMYVWSSRLSTSCDPYLVEPYVQGTECDFNIVLERGKLLFYEMVDEPAAPGDAAKKETSGSRSHDKADIFSRDFLMTCLSIPTQANAERVDSVLRWCLEALDRLGFVEPTGVFHFEARYQPTKSDQGGRSETEGQLGDSNAEEEEDEDDMGVFLIELNPRAPGVAHTACSRIVHGVDEAGCYYLSALGRPLLPACLPAKGSRPMAFAKNVFVAENKAGTQLCDPLAVVREREDVLHPVSWPVGFRFPGPASTLKFWSAMYVVFSTLDQADCDARAREVQGLVDVRLALEEEGSI